MSKNYLLRLLSITGFTLALLFHVLSAAEIYRAGFYTIGLLTTGMILIWLIASRQMRLNREMDQETNPLRIIFSQAPDWWRYLAGFFTFYALLNFFISIGYSHSQTWIESDPSFTKIRAISALWMLFYILGCILTYSVNPTTSDENEA